MAGTTIAQASEQQAQLQPPTLTQLIHRMGPEIQRALPAHLSGERIARLALTEIRKSEMAKASGKSKHSLADCQPESFVGALLTASAIGVEVGTPEAYLVPYSRECQLIIGYQGYTKLFWQHPQAAALDAFAVFSKDEFDYSYGLDAFLRHKPVRGDRGPIVNYYAAVSLSTGGRHFEVFTPEEIKELRAGKVGGNGGIRDPQRWMERKTAIRQVLKPMPKSVQMARAVESDERPGSELYMERLAEKDPAKALTPGVDPATGELTNPTAALAAGEAGDHDGPSQDVLDAMARGE
jgi:recombination protein RecT